MKRWLSTLVVFAVFSAVVRADVTIVQNTTVEGGMAAAAGPNMSPKITTRIKGMKARTDIEMPMGGMSTIADLTAKQIIILQHSQKTAQIVSAPAAGTTSTTSTAPPVTATVTLDASVTPTGKSQVIDGLKCDEFTFTTSFSMADMGGVPPEAAAMMKDVTMLMKGSMWVTKDAPGGVEYLAYQKALSSADLVAAAAGMSGVSMPGMDKMMKAMSSVNGLAYLTEMTMSFAGSGPMVDMMRQMGAMKMTMRTTSISADPISDDLLKVPEGYTIVK